MRFEIAQHVLFPLCPRDIIRPRFASFQPTALVFGSFESPQRGASIARLERTFYFAPKGCYLEMSQRHRDICLLEAIKTQPKTPTWPVSRSDTYVPVQDDARGALLALQHVMKYSNYQGRVVDEAEDLFDIWSHNVCV